MENKPQFKVKNLQFTYKEYFQNGNTLENLIIDKYVIYEQIGTGSYGSVYRGMDDQTKQQVAVKVLDMRSIKNEANPVSKSVKLRLAESEPKLMYMCDSPYLLKCYDAYENQDLKVMIIEYCNGKTLQTQIDQKGRIPENQAWTILKHIIKGLMVMHSFGIVHRDLKAENIMSHNGTYKIIDFGFSKKLEITKECAEVRNTSLGTITTMAPQVMARKPYGLKADIWSLGIIFFQMIYGKYPYDSVTANKMYREIRQKKLFNTEIPFSFNGFTPSIDAYNFLKFTLVVQSENRPDWKQVSEYPNIKKLKEEHINQWFIKQCQVVADEQLDCNEIINEKETSAIIRRAPKINKKEQPKLEKKQQQLKEQNRLKQPHQAQIKINRIEQNDKIPESIKKQAQNMKIQEMKNDKKINLSEQTNNQIEQNYLKDKNVIRKVRNKEELNNQQNENKKVELREEQQKRRQENPFNVQNHRALNQGQVRKKEAQINNKVQLEYEWTQDAHLECLKTQFIYRQIIYPLQIADILKLNNRTTVQFFYLLATRSFNNMSPVQDELAERNQKRLNVQLINNLNEQISPLYLRVLQKFNYFSSRLTESENKYGSIIKDWFSKKIYKQDFKEKDRIFTGLEKIDYSKEEQIEYTFKYYQENIMATLQSAGKNLFTVTKRMDYYRNIMLVKREELIKKGFTFNEYVKSLLRENKS